jgi:hypothetical protein
VGTDKEKEKKMKKEPQKPPVVEDPIILFSFLFCLLTLVAFLFRFLFFSLLFHLVAFRGRVGEYPGPTEVCSLVRSSLLGKKSGKRATRVRERLWRTLVRMGPLVGSFSTFLWRPFFRQEEANVRKTGSDVNE